MSVFIINLNTATAWGSTQRWPRNQAHVHIHADHQSATGTPGKSFVWDILLWGKILQNISACCLCLGAHSHSSVFWNRKGNILKNVLGTNFHTIKVNGEKLQNVKYVYYIPSNTIALCDEQTGNIILKILSSAVCVHSNMVFCEVNETNNWQNPK